MNARWLCTCSSISGANSRMHSLNFDMPKCTHGSSFLELTVDVDVACASNDLVSGGVGKLSFLTLHQDPANENALPCTKEPESAVMHTRTENPVVCTRLQGLPYASMKPRRTEYLHRWRKYFMQIVPGYPGSVPETRRVS